MEGTAAEFLLRELEARPEVAVAAPALVFRSAPDKVFSLGGRLLRNGRTLHRAQGAATSTIDDTPRNPRSIAWADGACLALDLGAFNQVGGFDEYFFLYVEEVDLQLRLHELGFDVLLVPLARAMQEPGYYTLYYKYRNLTYLTRKHRGLLSAWPWLVAFPKDVVRMLALGRPWEFLWAIRGVIDQRRGVGGQRPRTPFATQSSSLVAKLSVELRNLIRDGLIIPVASSALVPDFFRARLLRLFGFAVGKSRISSGLYIGGWRISIGEESFVGRSVYFDASASIAIGSRVQIAPFARFITSSHEIGESLRRAGSAAARPIVVGDGTWIGAGATVLPGVTIGAGAVIAAGAVVTKDCLANRLYAGVPAREVRSLP